MNDDWSDLADDVRDIWDENAAYWDEAMGEGNHFQQHLVWPATERLLELQSGQRVLDIACGNGVSSRSLAALGAEVVGVDVSPAMIEKARQRTDENTPITYQVADASKEDEMLALGKGSFDAIICNMAIMDIPAIDTLYRAAHTLIKPGGRFIYSITHPCFNSTHASRMIEEADVEGEIETTFSVRMKNYLEPIAAQGVAMAGQPRAQWYFDRPLSVLLQASFAAGWMMDAIEEPAFPEDLVAEPRNKWFSWILFKGIPPVLVVRLRAESSN